MRLKGSLYNWQVDSLHFGGVYFKEDCYQKGNINEILKYKIMFNFMLRINANLTNYKKILSTFDNFKS